MASDKMQSLNIQTQEHAEVRLKAQAQIQSWWCQGRERSILSLEELGKYYGAISLIKLTNNSQSKFPSSS